MCIRDSLVGAHKGGYDSFWLDITDFVSFTGDNLLAVRVDASGREGWWYEGGGIYRHVALEDVYKRQILCSVRPDIR